MSVINSSTVVTEQDITATLWNTLLQDLIDVEESSPPIGSIFMWGTGTAPDGYALCDGSAISRTTYADLFALLGTTFGAGDGSTTFNLPNFEDRFPVGAGNSYSVNAAGGNSTNNISHTHSVGTHTHSIPSHNHSIPSHSHNQGSLVAKVVGGGGGSYYEEVSYGSWTSNKRVSGTYASVAAGVGNATDVEGSTGSWSGTSGSWSGTTGSGGSANTGSGGSSSLENKPPYRGINFIIKVSAP